MIPPSNNEIYLAEHYANLEKVLSQLNLTKTVEYRDWKSKIERMTPNQLEFFLKYAIASNLLRDQLIVQNLKHTC